MNSFTSILLRLAQHTNMLFYNKKIKVKSIILKFQ
ncbi:Uncharacterised protein [Klebsiella pneumoniae]|nr:Uncharacterised protein [Klebsiella pneumoniae]